MPKDIVIKISLNEAINCIFYHTGVSDDGIQIDFKAIESAVSTVLGVHNKTKDFVYEQALLIAKVLLKNYSSFFEKTKNASTDELTSFYYLHKDEQFKVQMPENSVEPST
jgi:hypothetical protein